MGCRELIEALRAAGEEKVRSQRAAAEQDAARMRAEADARIDRLRRSRDQEHAAAAAQQAEALLAEAAADARRERIRSERALADRLAGIARAALPSLRNVGYADVFASFVQELPRLEWRTVKVNPADVTLARSHFPGAEVLPDEGISGGLIAQTEGRRIQVVNTFETRLEHLWEDLLPEIMQEVQGACG